MNTASSHNVTAEELEFQTERNTVCDSFAGQEGHYQPGQLTRVEYLAVGFLLVATYIFTLVVQ
ncbi:hypothetical protein AUR04nite_05130 [Glutamicibacter uratoxydans]|uniref:Uncharacterized protein n=1 Tax=Glutamicibacter uratoxydans TaxID=43667 RepID=A0A4Y4DR51_GLUUR|nr:hypothetical protein AUR04nite_05130 [Glutamicibacter uratoxydans]